MYRKNTFRRSFQSSLSSYKQNTEMEASVGGLDTADSLDANISPSRRNCRRRNEGKKDLHLGLHWGGVYRPVSC